MKLKLLILIVLLFSLASCSSSLNLENYLKPINYSNDFTPCLESKEFTNLTLKDTNSVCYTSDSLKISFTMAALENFYVLKLAIKNSSNHKIELYESNFNLLDSKNFQFKQFSADALANFYASKVRGYPIYKPKVSDYSYKTTGKLNSNGEYTATTRAKKTLSGAFSQAGDAIANAIIARKNSDLLKFANKVYNEGFGISEIISPGTGIKRNIYWTKDENDKYPIYVKFNDLVIPFGKY